MITGISVAGFGLGAMIWVKLAGSWGNLIPDYGIADTFIIYGVLFSISVLIDSAWMRFPPHFEPPAARGFGSFKVKSYNSYQGRNPKTGEIIKVREKKLPYFKVGKEMKERVDSD